MITKQQMGEVARILGFPNLSPMSSLQVGYPYFSSQLAMFQPYAMLLNRLSQASPDDEVQYFGAESPLFAGMFIPAQIGFVFSSTGSLTAGSVVQMNLNGETIEYTIETGDTPATVVAALFALAMNDVNITDSFMVNGIGTTITAFYTAGLGGSGNGFQCIAASSDSNLQIQVVGVGTPAQVATGATGGGTNPPGPRFLDPEATEPIYGYVPIIRILESDLINARINLDTLKADVWEPRQDELSVRAALWRKYRAELADRISVPLDPDIAGNQSRSIQRVV